jgi:hypothetical protein
MAITDTFREIALKAAPKQAKEIDAVSEEAPIFAMMPMAPASNGIQHVYETLNDVDGAKIVDLDAVLPEMNTTTELISEDLSVLGGIIKVGEDKALKMGGAAAYIAKKLPSILRSTAQNIEISFIYNTALPYAKANSREILAGGSTADKEFSILCVRWIPEETTGLFDQAGFGSGKVFDVQFLNGGSLANISNGSGGEIPGYEARIKNYLGFQLANPRNVSSIRNIDLVADAGTDTGFKNLPTESQIDDMLLNARANPANTFMYMHPKVANALNVYKGGALEMSPTDQDFNRTFFNWNGIRIITSYNFSETEAVVS